MCANPTALATAEEAVNARFITCFFVILQIRWCAEPKLTLHGGLGVDERIGGYASIEKDYLKWERTESPPGLENVAKSEGE